MNDKRRSRTHDIYDVLYSLGSRHFTSRDVWELLADNSTTSQISGSLSSLVVRGVLKRVGKKGRMTKYVVVDLDAPLRWNSSKDGVRRNVATRQTTHSELPTERPAPRAANPLGTLALQLLELAAQVETLAEQWDDLSRFNDVEIAREYHRRKK